MLAPDVRGRLLRIARAALFRFEAEVFEEDDPACAAPRS